MDPSPSLTTLPNELTNMIFRDICADKDERKKDLGSLRLTCKHLSAYATREFAGYFTEIPILMTRYGLEALIGICGHPVFGPGVRTVKLSSIRVCPDKLGDTVGQAASSIRSGHVNRMPVVKRTGELAKSGLDRTYYETELKDSLKIKLLTTAFGSLAQIGNAIQLVISHHERTSIGHIYRSSDQKNPVTLRTFDADDVVDEDIWENQFRDTLQMSIYAADKAACRVDYIKMEIWTLGTEQPGRRESGRIGSKVWNTVDPLPIWSSIKTVIFDLVENEARLAYHTIGEIVSLTRNITEFRWSIDPSYDFEWGFDEIATSIVSNSLEVISINEARLSEEKLMSLILGNCATLSHLSLQSIDCHDGHWHSIVTSIRDNLSELPHPSFVSLEMLYDDYGNQQIGWEAFEGRENVRNGLQLAMQDLNLPA